MYINEIPSGVEVVLSCYAGNKWIKFKLETDKLKGPKAIKSVEDAVKARFLVTGPAHSQGKIVSFPQGYKYDISFASEGKLSTWNNVRVYNLQINKPKKKVLIICSNEQSKRTDRRRSYRMRVNTKGEARFGENGEPEGVIVKDVSETGIGVVVTERNTKAKAGDIMTVNFTGKKEDDTFTIRSKIVRTEKMSGGKTVYGAVIIGARAQRDIKKYIEKERKMVPQK